MPIVVVTNARQRYRKSDAKILYRDSSFFYFLFVRR